MVLDILILQSSLYKSKSIKIVCKYIDWSSFYSILKWSNQHIQPKPRPYEIPWVITLITITEYCLVSTFGAYTLRAYNDVFPVYWLVSLECDNLKEIIWGWQHF